MLHRPTRTIRTLSTLLRFMTSSSLSYSTSSSSASAAVAAGSTAPTTATAPASTSFSSPCAASTSAPLPTSFQKHVPIPANGVDYRGKIVLAPMVRSGELPTRMIALRYGADLVWGPETIDRAMIGTKRHVNSVVGTIDFVRQSSNHARQPAAGQNGQDVKEDGENGGKQPKPQKEKPDSVIYRLHPEAEGRKLIFQMGTADPALAVQAARLVARDVAGIDVNAGCPKPFSVLGGMGAALLRTPDRLTAILEALVTQIGAEYQIGISVKIRLLETAAETEALVRRLCATGITGLTIHCRTTPMRPRERAIREQLHMIASVCREAGVACLMNGDVADRDGAEALIREYGVDGAMIASAAEKNPSCFRSQAQGGLLPWRQLGREYLETAMSVHNKFGNTKFLLAQMLPGKERDAQAVQQARSYEDLVVGLGLDGDLLARAREVDEIIGIRLKTPDGEWTQRTSKKDKSKKRASLVDGKSNGGSSAKRANIPNRVKKAVPASWVSRSEGKATVSPAAVRYEQQSQNREHIDHHHQQQATHPNHVRAMPVPTSHTVIA